MDIRVTLLIVKKLRKIRWEECFKELIKNVEIQSKDPIYILADDYLNNQKLRRKVEEELEKFSAKIKGIPIRMSFKKCLAGLEVADYFASITWNYYEKGKFKEYFDAIAGKIAKKEEIEKD